MLDTLSLTEQALRIAVVAHAPQVRKSDGSPYIVHPMMCALMLAQQGFPELVVASALVHDVLEDTPYTREMLQQELGEDVVRIVEGVSEDKALPWRERKELYAQTVAKGDDAIFAVSIADKIHNLESMARGCEEEGEDFLKHFTRGKEDQLWFFSRMLEVYTLHNHPLVATYTSLVQRFTEVLSTTERV